MTACNFQNCFQFWFYPVIERSLGARGHFQHFDETCKSEEETTSHAGISIISIYTRSFDRFSDLGYHFCEKYWINSLVLCTSKRCFDISDLFEYAWVAAGRLCCDTLHPWVDFESCIFLRSDASRLRLGTCLEFLFKVVVGTFASTVWQVFFA